MNVVYIVYVNRSVLIREPLENRALERHGILESPSPVTAPNVHNVHNVHPICGRFRSPSAASAPINGNEMYGSAPVFRHSGNDTESALGIFDPR